MTGIRRSGVQTFDLEDHRPGTVIAAGDHHLLVAGPAVHDRAALEGSVDVVADGAPGFGTELPVQHGQVVFLGDQELLPLLEDRAGADGGVGQILLCQVLLPGLFQYRDFNCVFPCHVASLLRDDGCSCFYDTFIYCIGPALDREDTASLKWF